MRPSSPKYGYRSLDDDSTVETPLRAQQNTRRLFLLLATTILALMALAGLLLYQSLVLSHSIMPQPRLSCGHSIAEAKQANCSFDLLGKAWLPAACPRHGTEEFLAAAATNGNESRWRYWRDEAGTQELSLDELASLSKGEHWWGTEREHLTHCAWLLVRKAYAMQEGGRVDKLTADYDHSKHCTLLLLRRALQFDGIDEIDTVGNVAFESC